MSQEIYKSVIFYSVIICFYIPFYISLLIELVNNLLQDWNAGLAGDTTVVVCVSRDLKVPL
jgi:hypothetical protein